MSNSAIARPPGGGWEPVPRGTKGGFRRRRGKKYDYRYPERGAKLEAAHAAVPTNLRAFRRAGSAWKGVAPGKPVEVAGAEGVWHYAPELGGETGKLAPVKRVSDGAVKVVRKDRIFALEKRSKPKLVVPAKKKFEDPTKPPKREPPPRRPSELGRPMPRLKDGSKAAAGSIVRAIETGQYPYKITHSYHPEKRGVGQIRRMSPHLPDEDRARLIQDYKPLVSAVAKKVMRNLRIPDTGTVREDVEAGGVEGLVRALSSYRVKEPFGVRAVQYVNAYAAFAARRELAGGMSVQDRHARAFARYQAARAQARAALRGDDPDAAASAARWRTTKGDLYSKLTDAEKREPLPEGPWEDRAGHARRGKTAWAESFEALAGTQKHLRGREVRDALESEADIPDPREEATPEAEVSAAEVRRVRQGAVKRVVDRLPEPHRTVLRMKLGFHREDGEGATDKEIAGAFKVPKARGKGFLGSTAMVILVPRIYEEAKQKLAEITTSDQEARRAIVEAAQADRPELPPAPPVGPTAPTPDPSVEYGQERTVRVRDLLTGEERTQRVQSMRGTPYRERTYPAADIEAALAGMRRGRARKSEGPRIWWIPGSRGGLFAW